MIERGGKPVETHATVPPVYDFALGAPAPLAGSAEITAPLLEGPDWPDTDVLSNPAYARIFDIELPLPDLQPPAETDIIPFDIPNIRPVTIERYARHDVVINNSHPDSKLAVAAAGQLAEGIPKDWVRVPVGEPTHRYYADTAGAPTLFAKVRDDVSINDLRSDREDLSVYSGSLPPAEVAGLEARTRAKHSVLNEIYNTPTVRAVITSESAQSVARALQYTGVSFVEPLAAVIDRTTGQKAVIYPYQAGQSTAHIDQRSHPLHGQQENLKSLSYVIRDLLGRAGIDAHDLSVRQFIVEDRREGRHLHLIDIECFSRMSSPRDTH